MKIDLNELGQVVGMTRTEVDGTLQPSRRPRMGRTPPIPPQTTLTFRTPPPIGANPLAVAKEIGDRVRGQVEASFRVNDWSRPFEHGL